MKIFFLFLLTILVVTAAPLESSNECKIEHFLLKEIIDDLDSLNKKEIKQSQDFVENIITPEHCTQEKFCKAAIVLSAYKAEQLGLKEKEWLLPKRLVAYSRNHHCNVKQSTDQVHFHQLLENIRQCAQKEFKKKSCEEK